MYAMAHTAIGVAGHQREAFGEVCQARAGGAQFLHEGERALRVVLRDVVAIRSRSASAPAVSRTIIRRGAA